MGANADRDLRRAEAILRSLGKDAKWQWIPRVGMPRDITVKVSRNAIQGKSQAQDQTIDRIEVFVLKNESHAEFGGVRIPYESDQLFDPSEIQPAGPKPYTFKGVVIAETAVAWKLQLERRNERRQGIR